MEFFDNAFLISCKSDTYKLYARLSIYLNKRTRISGSCCWRHDMHVCTPDRKLLWVNIFELNIKDLPSTYCLVFYAKSFVLFILKQGVCKTQRNNRTLLVLWCMLFCRFYVNIVCKRPVIYKENGIDLSVHFTLLTILLCYNTYQWVLVSNYICCNRKKCQQISYCSLTNKGFL